MTKDYLISQNYLFASILTELHTKNDQKEDLYSKLEQANKKLNKVNEELQLKDNIIQSLEDDIAHMIEQINRIGLISSPKDSYQ